MHIWQASRAPPKQGSAPRRLQVEPQAASIPKGPEKRALQQFDPGEQGFPLLGFGIRMSFQILAENILCSDNSVLQIRTGFAFKGQGILEIKGDDCSASIFQQEVTQRAHRDHPRNQLLLCEIGSHFPRLNFLERALDERLNEIVGLDALPFSSGNLHIASRAIFLVQLQSHLLRAARRKPYHFIGKMVEISRLLRVAQSQKSPPHNLLEIRLPSIDDGVSLASTAKSRSLAFP